MSKRVKAQITKERLGMDSRLSDEEESPLPPKRASDAVLARRPIAKFGKRFNKQQQPAVSITTATPTNTIDEHQANQLKSLNANFLKSLNDSINLNPIADLNPIIKKYADYYAKIINSEIEVKTLDVPKVEITQKDSMPVDDSKPNPFAIFSSFNSTSAPALPIKNPSPKPELELIEVDSDSEEDDESVKKEIKIQGPSFKLDKVPTSRDYSFKFGYVPPKNEDDSDSEVEIKGPTFKLDAPIKDSVFKLPKTSASKIDDKPVAATPAFSFGATKTDEKPTATSPAFSFGATKTDEKPTAATPAFSFGATKTDEKPTAATPAFTFGATKTDDKPAAIASSFSFAGTSAKTEGKPLFSFNPSKTEEETKPAAAPAFSFGKTADSEQEKPAFSFNPASSSAFTFNSTSAATSNGETKSAFTFGSTPSVSTPQAPASFSFSVPKPQEGSTPTAPTNKAEGGEEDEETQKDEVKGNFAIVKLNEKVDIQTGEEDEDTLYTKRSKISQLKEDKSGYDSKGLGDLKVLKSKSNGKSRILVRSDGGLNVILNVPISKDIKYEIIGNKNNIVKVPVFTETGVETYICQVKTNGDAEELLKNIKDCQ